MILTKKQQILISLCIIAKNEEQSLPNCLLHIGKIVDEIILVDTGSTDKTVEIAKQAGAKIYKKKWKNDFSDARNFAIKKATGKWILFLDADEMIPLTETKKIQPLLDNPMFEGYLLNIHTYLPHMALPILSQSLRLFRNRKEYQYQHRVYERISENLVTNTKETDIILEHRPNPVKYRDMKQLKDKLVANELEEHPTDAYLRYAYGIELFNNRKFEKSIEQFQLAIKYGDPHHLFSPHLYKLLVLSQIELKKYHDALTTAKQGLEYFPTYTDLNYYLGKILMELDNDHEAILQFEKCIKLGDATPSMIPEPGLGTYQALFTLAESHEKILNWEKAIYYYRNAYQVNQDIDEPLYKIGSIIKQVPQLGKMDEILLDSLNRSNSNHLFTLVDILCLEREYTTALAYTNEIEKMIGKNEDIAFIRGICHMMLGDALKAEEIFTTIPKEHTYYPPILLRRIQNFWFHDNNNQASRLLKELISAENISPSTKNAYQLMHSIFSNEVIQPFEMNDKETQLLAKTTEHLIVIKQKEKAKLLYPLLLQSSHERHWIEIGRILARENEIEDIIVFMDKIQDHQIKKKYREQVAKIYFLQQNYQNAHRLLACKNPKDYGTLSYLIWSKLQLIHINEIIHAAARSKKIALNKKQKLLDMKELIFSDD